MKWQWLNRILGRGKRKEKIPSSVSFDEIDSWLVMTTKSLFHALSTNAPWLYGEIKDARDNLKQSIIELRDATPDMNMPPHIVKLGLSNREKMTQRLLSFVEKMSLPSETATENDYSYKTVLSFYNTSISRMESALALGKSTKSGGLSSRLYYIKSLFPPEVEEVVSQINRLKDLLDQLVAPLKGKESCVFGLERAPKIIQELKNLRATIKEEEERVRTKEKKVYALNHKIEVDRERLLVVEEGKEWMEFKGLESQLSSLKEEFNTVELNFNDIFSPISKALNLLQKQCQTEQYPLPPDEKKVLSLILSSPIGVLDADEDTGISISVSRSVKGLLQHLRSAIEENVIILKERKRDKTRQRIDHLLSALTEISDAKRRRDGLKGRIKEVEATLLKFGPTIQDKEGIERSLVSDKEQLAFIKEEITRAKKHIVSLQERVMEKKRDLVAVLETIAGDKVEVRFK